MTEQEINLIRSIMREEVGDLRGVMREEINAAIYASEQRMEARFVSIDGRFEQIDARFVSIDERFERIDARLNHVEGMLQPMSEHLVLLGAGQRQHPVTFTSR